MTPKELLAIRNELRMFRPEFSKKVGVSPRMVVYYEDGEADIPLKVANSAKWIRHCHRLAQLKKGK